ncbi:glycosyltransferase family 4 protein [Gimesia chilikensis]|nr:glycosyltransferase family 4 protein [Gimesia chilikensis]
MKKIRLGICMPNCAMGGVNRGHLSMMNSQVDHDIEWSGIAIGHAALFDIDTARLILKHCPIYCTKDNPKFKGLVTIVPNACQTIINRSDIVKFWGYIKTNPEIESADWNSKPMLIVAHGECEWTRNSLAISLAHGTRHHMVSVSEGGLKCFPEAVQDRVKVIHNGVDFSRCAPSRSRDEVRQDWGIPEGVKTVGHVGRFGKDKNPLSAAKAVAELGEGFHAVYAGTGYQRDLFVEEVKNICGDQITILPRIEDVGTIFTALDCMVLASPSEACPNAVLESWLSSCPVVATPVGIIPHLESKHGELTFGVAFDPSPGELARAVRLAVQADNRVERAHWLAWNQFSSNRMVKNYESFFKDIL